ncbi:MAG: type II secretion system protein [Planctomycetes bacterium]|nr:type II secretion system protein [Planctomycetota bacterium]
MPQKAKNTRSGFTLIELLVVMAIIAGVAALSLSGYFYMERASRYRRSATQAYTTFVAAAETARWLQAPAWVSVDPESGEVKAYGLETVASWHFEMQGASKGIQLEYQGNVEVKPGYAGDGIMVGMDEAAPEGGGVVAVPVGKFAQGGFFECYVRPMYYGMDQEMFKWGNGVSLKITMAGRVEGRVGGETLRNPDLRVNLFRWTRFGILFSRDYISVMMDDAELAGRKPKEFPDMEGLVEVPSVEHPVHGYMDEARLLRVRVVGEWKPQSGLKPKATEQVYVWFKADGTLDAEKTPGPFRLTFETDGGAGKSFDIVVSPEGEVSIDMGGTGGGGGG